MILSRSLKMEKMLTLLEIAGDLCGKPLAAGFKPPPSHHERHADRSILDPTRENPGLSDRA